MHDEEPQQSSVHAQQSQPKSLLGLIAFLGAAVIAATTATFAIAEVGTLFDYSDDLKDRTSAVPGLISLPPDLQAEVDSAGDSIRLKTTSLSFALVGAIFAACFGIGAGLAHKSARVGISALLCGVPCVAMLGAIGGCAGQWFDDIWKVNKNLDAFLLPVLMHWVAWLFVVGGCVAVVTWSSRGTAAQLGSNLLWSVFALVIALVVFQLLAPLFFIDRTNIPIPEGFGNRVLWTGLVAGQLALVLHRTQAPGGR